MKYSAMKLTSNNKFTTATTEWIFGFAEIRNTRALARNAVSNGSVGAKKPRMIGDENIAQSHSRTNTVE